MKPGFGAPSISFRSIRRLIHRAIHQRLRNPARTGWDQADMPKRRTALVGVEGIYESCSVATNTTLYFPPASDRSAILKRLGEYSSVYRFEYEDIPGAHRGQRYQSRWSLSITVQDRAVNCYFEMPFGSGARVTLTNDGVQDAPNLYFHVDYQEFRDARGFAGLARSGSSVRW